MNGVGEAQSGANYTWLGRSHSNTMIDLDHANDCLAAIGDNPNLCNCKPRAGKPDDPVEMLQEIEAYLTFRLMSETPTVPEKDMRGMKHDIALLLRRNGVKGYEYAVVKTT